MAAAISAAAAMAAAVTTDMRLARKSQPMQRLERGMRRNKRSISWQRQWILCYVCKWFGIAGSSQNTALLIPLT
eukprot:4643274-Pleurochrysis_carterae.AAC.1